jgi:hypothetical protein
MIDFTLHIYSRLLEVLMRQGYSFFTFHEYACGLARGDKWAVLRHDVDDRPENSLRMARLQAEKGVRGTYYFRIVKQSFDATIMQEIAKLGHEIGFHYETMDSQNGNVEKAYGEFSEQLKLFREVVPVTTISMHGSPLSPYDNRKIWKYYNYRSLGIVGEPYFDLDFNQVFYITDTGRRWDGHRFNVRDKAIKENPITNADFLERCYRSTKDIIKAIDNNEFPNRAMLNIHPQRWNNEWRLWIGELVLQNVKNLAKMLIVLKSR